MKTIFVSFFAIIIFSACDMMGERIKGNGNIKTVDRQISDVTKINVIGSLEATVETGSSSLQVEGDENLLQYIETSTENGLLTIKMKDNIHFVTSNSIKVHVTLPRVAELKIISSGKIMSNNQLINDDKTNLKILGSGKIHVKIHAPKINADIKGSGDIIVEGETKDLEASIKGSGTFKGENLKSENASISIAGSGDVYVFSDIRLKISIAGSGNVKYKGNAVVETNVAGSGSVKRLP